MLPGHFGFSVQKKIWLEVGGKVDYDTECKLGDRVGWRKRRKGRKGWLEYDDLTFNLEAPRGHLPSCARVFAWGGEGLGLVVGVLGWLGLVVWFSLLSHREL